MIIIGKTIRNLLILISASQLAVAGPSLLSPLGCEKLFHYNDITNDAVTINDLPDRLPLVVDDGFSDIHVSVIDPIHHSVKNSVEEISISINLDSAFSEIVFSPSLNDSDTLAKLISYNESAGEVKGHIGNIKGGHVPDENFEKVLEILNKERAGENHSPYFIGRLRAANKDARVHAERIAGYQFNVPRKAIRFDFSEEFPGLTEYNLRAFDLNAEGKLSAEAKEDAIAYLKKYWPDAENYNISYLNQGGFNAVFKASPKDGSTASKVLKLPGLDAAPLKKLGAVENEIKVLNKRIDAVKEEMIATNNQKELASSTRELRYLYEKLESLATDRDILAKKVRTGLDNYKKDLFIIAWADEAYKPGNGPTIYGREFIMHASINRDPKLLSKGIVEQDCFDILPQDNIVFEKKAMIEIQNQLKKGTADYLIFTKYADPTQIKADIFNLLELTGACSQAKFAAMRVYCKSLMDFNDIPEYAELHEMAMGWLQSYEDIHPFVAEATFNYFGINRANGVEILNGNLVNGYYRGGELRYSPVGFDPLEGTNVFWSRTEKKLGIIDR